MMQLLQFTVIHAEIELRFSPGHQTIRAADSFRELGPPMYSTYSSRLAKFHAESLSINYILTRLYLWGVYRLLLGSNRMYAE